MPLSQGDKNVVSNTRGRLGEKVKQYTDEHIAQTWWDFSLSEDYPDDDKFLEWLAS